MLKREKYVYWKFYLLSMVTCGVYYIYHEYLKVDDFAKATGQEDTSDAILALILAIFGMGFIADAILQNKINQHFEKPVTTQF